MRKTRIFSVAVFVIAVIVFEVFQYRQKIAADQIGPVINMAEPSVTISVTDGEEAILAGVTAEDQRDGDVTGSLLVEKLDNLVDGNTRQATIAAFDSAGNVTKTTRTVVYSDYVSPRFQLTEPLRYPVGSDEVLSGVTASDVLDGDLSEQIKASAETNLYYAEKGEYAITFSVSNSAGDVSKLEATVTYYDSTEEAERPKLLLSEYLIYLEAGENLNPRDYLQEIDVGGRNYKKTSSGSLICAQGDSISSGEVSVENPVDVNTPGTYEITYRYSSGGKEGSVRLIVVVED